MLRSGYTESGAHVQRTTCVCAAHPTGELWIWRLHN